MSRLSVLFLLSMLIALPTMAQERMDAQVMTLCQTPPMDAEALDRLRRGADYALLLDGLALHCPEVAMLFAEWTVGDVGAAAVRGKPRHPVDLLRDVGPVPVLGDTAAIPQF